jgi:hypothetical protein
MTDKKPMTTSWMWKQEDGEVWGLTIDIEKRKLEWFDGIGCACGDSFAEQTVEDFIQRGPRYGDLPDDVLNEVRESLETLGANPTMR